MKKKFLYYLNCNSTYFGEDGIKFFGDAPVIKDRSMKGNNDNYSPSGFVFKIDNKYKMCELIDYDNNGVNFIYDNIPKDIMILFGTVRRYGYGVVLRYEACFNPYGYSDPDPSSYYPVYSDYVPEHKFKILLGKRVDDKLKLRDGSIVNIPKEYKNIPTIGEYYSKMYQQLLSLDIVQPELEYNQSKFENEEHLENDNCNKITDIDIYGPTNYNNKCYEFRFFEYFDKKRERVVSEICTGFIINITPDYIDVVNKDNNNFSSSTYDIIRIPIKSLYTIEENKHSFNYKRVFTNPCVSVVQEDEIKKVGVWEESFENVKTVTVRKRTLINKSYY